MNDRKKFYNSKVWKQQRRYVWLKQSCLCAACKLPVYVYGISDENIPKGNRLKGIVHHKKWLTDRNFNEDDIALDENNLIGLCINCHNSIHTPPKSVKSGLKFDENGNLVKQDNSDIIQRLINDNN